MDKEKKLTPLMVQYWDIKNKHQDKILLFRMGDFFEIFYEDAVIAAPILNIALTSRNKKSNDETPMCGFPHHSLATPISKLLAAGHKVALCDQIEDPAQAKGLVKRAVTRILSPGMVYDPETLDQQTSNYICSFDMQSLSFLEASTGEVFYYSISSIEKIVEFIKILKPAEIVLSRETKQNIQHELPNNLLLATHSISQDPLPQKLQDVPESMRLLLDYARYMQGEGVLQSLKPVEERQLQSKMQLSSTLVRHLEVFLTYKGDKKGSLFSAINKTKTSAGARLLKQWLSFPLTDVNHINERQEAIQQWVNDPGRIKGFRKILSGLYDIERRLSKLSHASCSPKDILSLCESLEAGLAATEFYNVKLLKQNKFKDVIAVIQMIRQTIDLQAPVQFKKGGVIVRGYNPQLDEYIDLSENSKKLLLKMEQREKDKFEIPSLKIKYNNVFGYFIEVTNTHKNKVPEHYKRKQTLTNAERYITEELHELEGKILSAQSKRVELELEFFSDLKGSILKKAQELLKAADLWSHWDVFSSLAWLSLEQNYHRPIMSEAGRLFLENSRHPVVEQEVQHPFVPNTITMTQGHCTLLTGPNMAGKSTIMRQVACIALLAQIGCFIPASTAELPVFDQIFTRIGASDYLNEGLSTFMVEMTEAAYIAKQCTTKSLVILDEIGRGTSTYDGMSLAQSILEYLVSKKQCMTFFATHYHELTSMEIKWPQIQNAHMSIRDKGGEISFLHTLAPGPANRSYGIHVAKLAGVPIEITRRASQLLTTHESFSASGSKQLTFMDVEIEDGLELEQMIPTINPELEDLLDQIKQTSIQSMTPIEALNTIVTWQQKLS